MAAIRIVIISLSILLVPPAQAGICQRLLNGGKAFAKITHDPLLLRLPLAHRQTVRDIVLQPGKLSGKQRRRLVGLSKASGIPGIALHVAELKEHSVAWRWGWVLQSYLRTGGASSSVRLQGFGVGISKLAEWALWIMNPVPGNFYLHESEVRKLYDRIAFRPDAEVSESEWRRLAELGLTEDFELFQRLKAEEGLVRRGARQGKNALLVHGPQVAALLTLLLTADFDSSIPAAAYLNDLSQRPRIDYIIDTSMNSQAALRIDGVVYKPDQSDSSGISAQRFFAPNTESNRSLLVLSLDLSDHNVDRIRARLEELTWNAVRPVKSGATEIQQVLAEEAGLRIPQYASSSPSLGLAWLRSEGILGNPKVGSLERIQSVPSTVNTITQTFSLSVDAKLSYFTGAFRDRF